MTLLRVNLILIYVSVPVDNFNSYFTNHA